MLACILCCFIVSDTHSVKQLMRMKSSPCSKHCSRPGKREGEKKRKGTCSHRTDILDGGTDIFSLLLFSNFLKSSRASGRVLQL